tara:strand:- start:261 stop:467 length:207 start_codon:yes stop_codon:yes gene_type:complete
MNEKESDEMLQYMLDSKMIQTRMNRNTKEQEFALTEIGWAIMNMLKFFNGEIDETDKAVREFSDDFEK